MYNSKCLTYFSSVLLTEHHKGHHHDHAHDSAVTSVSIVSEGTIDLDEVMSIVLNPKSFLVWNQ